MIHKPVLIVGGSGTYGRKISRLFRRRNPELAIVLGARDLAKAQSLADELGNTSVASIDLNTPSLAGSLGTDYRAIGLIGYDPSMGILTHAAAHGIPYMGIAGGAFELCVDMVTALSGINRAPIVIASHWFAGAVAIPTILLARRFATIDSINIGILIDRGEQPGGAGAATLADFARINENCPATLARQSGRYVWLPPERAKAKFRRGDGTEIDGVGSVSPDVISIGAATRSPNVHILEGFAMSSARAAGGPASDEIYIQIHGKAADGRALELAQTLACPREPYSLTAITAVALLEKLAGLRGEIPGPGLRMPETVLDAELYVQLMQDEGVNFSGG
ncbi:hypothetical protein EN833_13225 [Mesorhizobium sp. M4B.F.Ca.ET.190.01.1.1]|uniref:hypothetical protein n=1 Tax=unclassified Mesorhizobium TaxID=325217 RepID=UPI0010921E59|nr:MULTISPECIES: hypothetical protein [unclassified Mesorhizobium]TGR10489.1 hypothetical protein EN843_13220 [Mesorhizobium sp. M4B.F.Ca.ET.200.01.1.1]TGS19579.1 hypothetical protein EN833_13225 [Mesorhizobium sp. M4B.F.Ca.ET.190.01.1.1]TGT32454.1 hypothetical protein EN815_08210 [Mesorhizobium sp. M4B.F.Ca.ET.172.01.1.1]